MTDRELFQMALSALEEYCQYGVLLCPIERREALRARLAQPEPLAQFKFQEYGPPNWGDSQVTKPEFVAEQKAMNEALRTMVEPVIQARKEGDLIVADLPQVPRGSGGISKREWVGLTDEESGAIMEELDAYGTRLYEFARAIEAKLREKNTKGE